MVHFIHSLRVSRCLVVGQKVKSSTYLQTGNPKGVMLTHGNVVADFSGFLKVTDVSKTASRPVSLFWTGGNASHCFAVLQKVIFPNQDDCLISFLPLAHMFERLIEVNTGINRNWLVWDWGGALTRVLSICIQGEVKTVKNKAQKKYKLGLKPDYSFMLCSDNIYLNQDTLTLSDNFGCEIVMA